MKILVKKINFLKNSLKYYLLLLYIKINYYLRFNSNNDNSYYYHNIEKNYKYFFNYNFFSNKPLILEKVISTFYKSNLNKLAEVISYWVWISENCNDYKNCLHFDDERKYFYLEKGEFFELAKEKKDKLFLSYKNYKFIYSHYENR